MERRDARQKKCGDKTRYKKNREMRRKKKNWETRRETKKNGEMRCKLKKKIGR